MTLFSTQVEILVAFPADKFFGEIANFDTIVPKLAPEIYKSITTIEGDGGVGTIKLCVHGDGVPYTTSKQKVDSIDLSNYSFGYTIFEGDVLSDYLESITHHVKISSTSDGGSLYTHNTVFNCKGETKPTEEVLNQYKQLYNKVVKSLEAYAIANANDVSTCFV